MKNKTVKILIIAAIAVALIMAGIVMVKESGMDTSKVQEVYLEVIADDGGIERIQVTDAEDVDFIKVCFNGDTNTDGSLEFAEGGYRIIMAQPDKEWHLYPYCGELTQVRIGDSGSKFLTVSEDDSSQLEQVFNKYIDTSDYDGTYDWKEVIMEDIKN